MRPTQLASQGRTDCPPLSYGVHLTRESRHGCSTVDIAHTKLGISLRSCCAEPSKISHASRDNKSADPGMQEAAKSSEHWQLPVSLASSSAAQDGLASGLAKVLSSVCPTPLSGIHLDRRE